MSSTKPARPRAMLPVLAASGASGVAGYVVLVLTARVLSPETNATFLVFWGALFAVFGVLVGVTTETTRAVFAADGSGQTRVLPLALAVGGSVALLVGLSGLVWAPLVLGDAWRGLLGAMVAGIVLFTSHSALAGSVAGSSAWGSYSLLVGSEAVSRLVLCVVVVVLGGQLLGLAWATALACGTGLVLVLVYPPFRRILGARARDSRRSLVRRMLVACSASGASALLLVGYPVLLRVTTPSDAFEGAAPIVLSVSLSRAPLMVPLGIYQNVLVTRVITDGLRVLRPVLAGLAALTAVGSGLAWAAGPWLLHLVNPAYDVSGPVFAALVLSAGLMATLTITGAGTVALDHHHVYLAGWIAATAVSLVVLLPSAALETRVISSLVAGPLVGAAVHVRWGLRRGH